MERVGTFVPPGEEVIVLVLAEFKSIYSSNRTCCRELKSICRFEKANAAVGAQAYVTVRVDFKLLMNVIYINCDMKEEYIKQYYLTIKLTICGNYGR